MSRRWEAGTEGVQPVQGSCWCARPAMSASPETLEVRVECHQFHRRGRAANRSESTHGTRRESELTVLSTTRSTPGTAGLPGAGGTSGSSERVRRTREDLSALATPDKALRGACEAQHTGATEPAPPRSGGGHFFSSPQWAHGWVLEGGGSQPWPRDGGSWPAPDAVRQSQDRFR